MLVSVMFMQMNNDDGDGDDGGSAYVESWLKEAQRSAGPRAPPPPSPLSIPNSGALRPSPPSPEPPDPLETPHTARDLRTETRTHEHEPVYFVFCAAATLINT